MHNSFLAAANNHKLKLCQHPSFWHCRLEQTNCSPCNHHPAGVGGQSCIDYCLIAAFNAQVRVQGFAAVSYSSELSQVGFPTLKLTAVVNCSMVIAYCMIMGMILNWAYWGTYCYAQFCVTASLADCYVILSSVEVPVGQMYVLFSRAVDLVRPGLTRSDWVWLVLTSLPRICFSCCNYIQASRETISYPIQCCYVHYTVFLSAFCLAFTLLPSIVSRFTLITTFLIHWMSPDVAVSLCSDNLWLLLLLLLLGCCCWLPCEQLQWCQRQWLHTAGAGS